MKDDMLYLIHISECIERIERYVGEGGKDKFMRSTLTQDAVLRNLQTMAESTQRLSNASQSAHPEIEWRKVSGFRNVLVHDYLSVDLERAWLVIENDLPELKRAIKTLLDERGYESPDSSRNT